ncbi:MAG: hypothetical protein EWV85_12730 [Microcystis aeruginosa Ma_QC_C_20070703_M131]|uniref:Uncharacterized protein n=1 Tax=Microcystis aeruginosa Ma_QC_C_20070703_M131 TaxID=2486263 RepID=A0A551XZ55_MICAE|nr:MAG: hypothetical protein EWV85_12730 [Microcystis aeruginosa Ma_QC_C_20070703_M131]
MPKKLFVGLGVSPDEKIFTTTDERGFFPYTRSAELTAEAHTRSDLGHLYILGLLKSFSWG